MHPNSSIIRLPWSLQRRLDAAAGALLNPQNGRTVDFTRPPGEAALFPPDSVSWRIFKNPVALLIGGIAYGVSLLSLGTLATPLEYIVPGGVLLAAVAVDVLSRRGTGSVTRV